jgi:hypothetical protein
VILAKTLKNMPFSTCCGAETDMEEIGICPECLEHCDFEDEDELEADRQTENQIEEEQINKHLNK